MPKVTLPPKKPGDSNVVVTDVHSIIVVGANGAGKTRLGAFIEQDAKEKVHRISAQRSLDIPISVVPRAYESAASSLLFGEYQSHWDYETRLSHKMHTRWRNEPATFMINDYEALLALLFAEEAKRNREYTRAALSNPSTSPPPKCNIDKLLAIWAVVMPQRTLSATDDRILATKGDTQPYEARRMSDGERVAIYLIGQALCAPTDGIIIIDEPEIHLHRAVQSLLWDQLEVARPDCTFVYITHDLEFAATRVGARRIWLKEYDGADWIWEEIGAASVLPDALAMQVLGSRRPILFVEGDETSHDASIYRALYPKEHVVPRQSCDKVIEATKTMATLPSLHHLSVRGLVDRDRRGDTEIAALKADGVSVADVAEVENLLCIPDAIAAVATQIKIDPRAAVEAAQSEVLGELRKQRDHQAVLRALAEIQFRLNGFGPKIANFDATKLEAEINGYVKGIDVGTAVIQAKALFEDVLATSDYLAALRLFNCKGIVAFVARALRLNADVYTGTVMGILREEPTGRLAEAMRRLIRG